MLRRVGVAINEEWVVGRDFNAMLNDVEKDGGQYIVRAQMNDFRDILDNLAPIDIKPDQGWFTVIDVPSCGDNVKRLRESRCKLDYLHAREERYWAQRSRAQWLKGNIKYFHAKATGRLKKNSIEKIKDENGNWVTNNKDICNTAKQYFWNLFQSNGNDITQLD
ncbi:hypothetical protein J1N35_019136 [Gossypium stocksii]|uniref:Endonuclease/exonuclease/phosphatase domain-containing protein n=1 Tax=Gossypium stocksii TaxID=47602 RepID=A0A9D3VQT8_9ROSI|nr:hypothetical protein J1N35_019136 [Gossypium stocksii]